jgi:outer membrane protein TolC
MKDDVQYAQYQERLLEEKQQLDDRLAKLMNFIGSATFQKLPSNYCDLLEDQKVAMEEYARILAARIDLFTSDYAPKAATGGPEPETPLPAVVDNELPDAPEPKGKHK